MTLTLRPARIRDIQRLTEIAHAAKRHWGYPEKWIVAWKEDLTVTPVTLAGHRVTVACRGGEICGFSALEITPPDIGLEHMWVHPEAMGAGVGRKLFENACLEAQNEGGKRLIIFSDPNAVGFYEAVGAKKTGEHRAILFGKPRILPIYTLEIG